MAEIVNLRQARKQKSRRDKEAAAETNRARFGRNKGERLRDKAAQARQKRNLDGKKID